MYKYLVYKATNKTNGKIYIGITNRGLTSRKREHKYYSTKKTTRFGSALKKYGIEGFNWEEMVFCKTSENCNELEKYLIAFYKSTNHDFGYNMTSGGDGFYGVTRDVIEKAKKKRKENAEKLGYWPSKGLRRSPEIRAKMGKHTIGVSPVNKGTKCSDEEKLRMRFRAPQRVPVIVLNLQSGIAQHFDSINHASKELNISFNTIRDVLINKRQNKKFYCYYAKDINLC